MGPRRPRAAGRALHREGEPAEAVKALDGIAPRDGALRLRRATWLHEAGQDEQAMAELAPMLDAGTPPAERFAAARQTGVYAHAAGDLQREQEALAIAHALRPDDGKLVLTAADNALSRGDLAAADGLLAGIDDVRAGADMVRKARTRRAEVALRRGDRPLAVALQRAVVASLAPADQDRPQQLLRLGRMEADAGDCAAAVATLAEVPPAGLPAHDRVERGICLTRLQQWDDAAEELALALRAPPAELEQAPASWRSTRSPTRTRRAAGSHRRLPCASRRTESPLRRPGRSARRTTCGSPAIRPARSRRSPGSMRRRSPARTSPFTRRRWRLPPQMRRGRWRPGRRRPKPRRP